MWELNHSKRESQHLDVMDYELAVQQPMSKRKKHLTDWIRPILTHIRTLLIWLLIGG